MTSKALAGARRKPMRGAMSALRAAVLVVSICLSPLPAVSQTVLGGQYSLSAQAAIPDVLTLDVVSYNVYLRPLLPEWQDVRAPLIAERLGGYDVVLLQEAYSDWHRQLIGNRLSEDYPYQARVLGSDCGFRQDGGVVLLSKWPIDVELQLLFGKLCTGKDCLADKGVLYARINKRGQPVHIFATHLQSGRENWKTRKRQLQVLGNLIEDLRLSKDEPVVIAGDFNVDRFANRETGHFSFMVEVLNAQQPIPSDSGSLRPTYDPTENWLAEGSFQEYIDYVFYSRKHLVPTAAFNTVQEEFTGDMPLSDHYAVHGRFVFAPAAQQSRSPKWIPRGMPESIEVGLDENP